MRTANFFQSFKNFGTLTPSMESLKVGRPVKFKKIGRDTFAALKWDSKYKLFLDSELIPFCISVPKVSFFCVFLLRIRASWDTRCGSKPFLEVGSASCKSMPLCDTPTPLRGRTGSERKARSYSLKRRFKVYMHIRTGEEDRDISAHGLAPWRVRGRLLLNREAQPKRRKQGQALSTPERFLKVS